MKPRLPTSICKDTVDNSDHFYSESLPQLQSSPLPMMQPFIKVQLCSINHIAQINERIITHLFSIALWKRVLKATLHGKNRNNESNYDINKAERWHYITARNKTKNMHNSHHRLKADLYWGVSGEPPANASALASVGHWPLVLLPEHWWRLWPGGGCCSASAPHTPTNPDCTQQCTWTTEDSEDWPVNLRLIWIVQKILWKKFTIKLECARFQIQCISMILGLPPLGSDG